MARCVKMLVLAIVVVLFWPGSSDASPIGKPLPDSDTPYYPESKPDDSGSSAEPRYAGSSSHYTTAAPTYYSAAPSYDKDSYYTTPSSHQYYTSAMGYTAPSYYAAKASFYTPTSYQYGTASGTYYYPPTSSYYSSQGQHYSTGNAAPSTYHSGSGSHYSTPSTSYNYGKMSYAFKPYYSSGYFYPNTAYGYPSAGQQSYYSKETPVYETQTGDFYSAQQYGPYRQQSSYAPYNTYY